MSSIIFTDRRTLPKCPYKVTAFSPEGATHPTRESTLSRGERVSASGAFTSRRTTGEGLVPSEMGRKKPLTRPATAGENAVAGHPLPKGDG